MLQNKNGILTILLFISIYFTTIVYSAFDTRLQIEGDAVVRTDQSVRITNLELTNTVNDAYEEYNSKYGKDTTSMYLILPASSSITYTVEITNKVSDSYLIDSITQESHTNSNVNVDISLKENDIVESNNTKKFTITLTNSTSSEQQETLVYKYGFKLNSFIVTFDANGGSGGTNSIQASYNSSLPNINIPTKSGYTFKGYYNKKDFDELNSEVSRYSAEGQIRINFSGTNNGWSMTTVGDTGSHINGMMYIDDAILAVEFNDKLLDASQYRIERVNNGSILYLDFDIEERMITNTYGTEYRFMDISASNSVNSEVQIIYLIKDGKKYYDASGNGLMYYDLAENTTLYAIWEPINYGSSIQSSYSSIYYSLNSGPKTQVAETTTGTWTGNFSGTNNIISLISDNGDKIITPTNSDGNAVIVNSGINTLNFTNQQSNKWVCLQWYWGGWSGTRRLSNINLLFNNNQNYTISQAVSNGYIEPFVPYRSADDSRVNNMSYVLDNPEQLLTGGSQAKAFSNFQVCFKVKELSPLKGVNFETNADWSNLGIDGFNAWSSDKIEFSL